MAFEIVDGHTGSAHISSEDLAPLNVGIVGASEAVFSWGDNFSLTMSSANAGTLGTGAGMVQGRRFWNKEAASITVTSGTSGMKRNDLVVARYSATGDGIESVAPVVLRGTPAIGTAADPAISPGDLKLWRIPIDGISVGTPVQLFTVSPSLKALGDSVSPTSITPTFADANVKKYFVGGFWRVGRLVVIDYFSSGGIPSSWGDTTIATGLPTPASDAQAWTPCVVQSSGDNARYMAHVNQDGSLVISNKSGGGGGNWIVFSLVYVAK